jgi:PAS domain S-box-containing protein
MEKLKPQKVFDLEHFFEIAPDLLCIAGFDGYFKKINPAVSKTLGYTAEELFSAPINSFVHPDDQLITSQKRSALVEGQSLLNFEEYDRISSILEMINDDHHRRFKKQPRPTAVTGMVVSAIDGVKSHAHVPTQSDQLWLNSFEMIVRNNVAKAELNLDLISDALALSQRQLFRRVDRILGITPNKLVRVIRLQLAWEAIATGKYRTIKEISHIAGYSSRSHFSKLFREVYGINVTELL